MIHPSDYITATDPVPPGENSAEGARKLQLMFEDAVASKQTIQLDGKTYYGNINLQNVKGLNVVGVNRVNSRIQSLDPLKPAIKLNGLWFSYFANFSVGCGSHNPTGAPFEIDRSLPYDNNNFGVQGNSYQDMEFDARGINDGLHSLHAITLNIESGSYGQGDMQNFRNCYFYGGSRSVYRQRGMNALSNCFWSGNFQGYPKHAIEIEGGSIHCYSTSFQCNTGIAQLVNDGWDIYDLRTGAFESIVLIGCRTESLRFALINSGHQAYIHACTQLKAIPDWEPHQNYPLKFGCTHNGYVCECIEPHTSEIEFNPVYWKKYNVNMVDAYTGSSVNNSWSVGFELIREPADNITLQINKDTKISHPVKNVLVDASNGPVNITLDSNSASWYRRGDILRIMKGDPTNNPVTVNCFAINNRKNQIILDSDRLSVALQANGNGTLPTRWYEC